MSAVAAIPGMSGRTPLKSMRLFFLTNGEKENFLPAKGENHRTYLISVSALAPDVEDRSLFLTLPLRAAEGRRSDPSRTMVRESSDMALRDVGHGRIAVAALSETSSATPCKGPALRRNRRFAI